jgi:PadR family transcriptional regulator PadR
MTDPKRQLVRGTLHVMILRTLENETLHGYGIASRIDRATRGVVELEDGTLYQALHRMEERGWVESTWGHAETGKRARFYALTEEGRRRLEVETASWRQYVEAVQRVLRPDGG